MSFVDNAPDRVHNIEYDDHVAYCVNDRKLALYATDNDNAWIGSTNPCTLRDWT